MFTPADTRKHEQYIRGIAQQEIDKPLDGDLILTLSFYIKNRNHGDIDNLIKQISDSLIGIAYQDDKQIKEIHAYLWYDKNERTEVEIKKIA